MRRKSHVLLVMALLRPLAYSPNGEYFAFSNPDGTLKLWETATGNLKQEYTPSSHLSATCTCLSWAPVHQPTVTPRKKKKKRSKSLEGEGGINTVDMLGLGTSSGSILLYSLLKGDLHTQLDGGHSDTVNCLCWQADGKILYSCSNDHQVIQWDLSKGTVKCKWKADKSGVHSIALCGMDKYLLSASRSIKLWDIHTGELLKTFAGHASEVFQILPLVGSESASPAESLKNTYFLSAAVGDRLINAWRIGSDMKEKNSLASFALPEEPVHVVMNMSSFDQVLLLAAVTRSGHLHLFDHVLNGRCKRPLRPKVEVQVASEAEPGDSQETSQPIPIVGTHVCDDASKSLLFSHGNFIRLTFEKKSYHSLDASTCLVRQDPSRSHITVESNSGVSKVRTPNVSQDITVLAPGHMAPSAPQRSDSSESQGKKKRRKSESKEMSIDDRLNAMSFGTSEGAKAPPKADTLAALLAQGIQSEDKRILNSVLQQTGHTVIRNTVRRLPLPVVIPFVKELARRMHGHTQSGHNVVKWIKAVLSVHSSYLMTYPELVTTLSGVYQLMDSRVAMLGRFSKLQGKLDLMLSQITSQTGAEEEGIDSQQPMLIYQDESSEEDAEEILTEADSGEDWEAMSDMEVGEEENAGHAENGGSGDDLDSDSDSDEEGEANGDEEMSSSD